MNKNILLINPWIYDFKAYDFWIKPLGLLYIASVLQEQGDNLYLINCIDRNLPYIDSSEGSNVNKKETFKDIKYGCGKFYNEEVIKPELYKKIPRKYKRYGIPINVFKEILENIPKPDYILITSIMTYWYLGVKTAIELVKNKFPDSPVILGGIYATLCPEHAKTLCPDFVIEGADIKRLLDIIYPDNKISSKKINNLITDYLPAYNLIPNIKTAAVITSVGCPYKCTYCASKILQKNFIQREQENVANEIIKYVQDFKVKDIAFNDDALLINYEKHLKLILDILRKNNINCNFHTPNGLHARCITEYVADDLFRSGFKTIRLGLETTNETTQYVTGNKINNPEFEKAIKNLISTGFTKKEIGVYVMIGLPEQSIEEVKETMEFVYSLGVKVYLTAYSPIPKTEDWYKLKADKMPQAQDPLWHNNTFQLYNSMNFHKISDLIKEVRERNQ